MSSGVPIQLQITNPRLRTYGGAPMAMDGSFGMYELRAMGVFFQHADGTPNLTKDPRPLTPTVGAELLPGAHAYISVGFSMRILDPCMGVRIVPHPAAADVGLWLHNGMGMMDAHYTGPLVLKVKNIRTPSYQEMAALALYATRIPNIPPLVIVEGQPIARMYVAPLYAIAWQEVSDVLDDAHDSDV